MRKYVLLIIGLILLPSSVHALDLSRVKTWSATEILTAADLNAEFNNILNHDLTNTDMSGSAGITCVNLDLATT